MADYKFFKNREGTNVGVTYKTTTIIPMDEDNTDYQEYLEWAKTNTTEAAD